MDSVAKLYAANGTTLLLDLNDAAAGYRTVSLPDADRDWQQAIATTPWMDGGVVVGEKLGLVTKQLRTRIRGASWPQVEQRFQAMLEVIETAPPWFLVIGKGGVDRTWRAAGRASSSSPDSAADVLNRTRVVVWTVLAQPSAAITGLPE